MRDKRNVLKTVDGKHICRSEALCSKDGRNFGEALVFCYADEFDYKTEEGEILRIRSCPLSPATCLTDDYNTKLAITDDPYETGNLTLEHQKDVIDHYTEKYMRSSTQQ